MNYTITDQVLLSIEGVSKSFDGVDILKDINLEIRDIRRTDGSGVKEAQVTALLGPSGVGKTTLFNIIAGLLKPDTGRVLIDNPLTPSIEGMSREDLIDTTRGLVGVVYQDYRLFDFKTVYEALEDGLECSALKLNNADKIAKIEEYLNWFQLEAHKDKFPFQLSGGQKQRVAIAQQLLRAPQLLLMDEPFSGLDPETKRGVIEMINALAQRDEYLTIVIISHDILSSLKVADSICMVGKVRDDNGILTGGATILAHKTIDLKALGLAWHQNDLGAKQRLAEIAAQIEEEFPYLSGKQ